MLKRLTEEIERRADMVRNIPNSYDEGEEFPDGELCYEDGRLQGRYEELLWCKELIRKNTFATDINVGDTVLKLESIADRLEADPELDMEIGHLQDFWAKDIRESISILRELIKQVILIE